MLGSKSYGTIVSEHDKLAASFSRKRRNDSRFPVGMTDKLSHLTRSSRSSVQSRSF